MRTFAPGDRLSAEDEFTVLANSEMFTIDYYTDDEVVFERIIVLDDEKLRDRIVYLLNEYGER